MLQMELHELSTEELVELATLQARLGQVEPATLVEVCARYSYHEVPKEDRDQLVKLDRDVFIPRFRHTKLPPGQIIPPGNGWPPPPRYYRNLILRGVPTDVFLSRPTVVEPKYEPGLDRFYAALEATKLRPRTIGISDTPLKSPFSEVDALIQRCKGMIVLGYPQFELTAGTFRGQAVRPGSYLPSEWNHIEGCLSYSRKMPTLLIAHPGIDRGIFATGSADVFVHQADLEDSFWAELPNVVAALAEFRKRL
jgi:hypothetical protein